MGAGGFSAGVTTEESEKTQRRTQRREEKIDMAVKCDLERPEIDEATPIRGNRL
jgi:hypothetical protein